MTNGKLSKAISRPCFVAAVTCASLKRGTSGGAKLSKQHTDFPSEYQDIAEAISPSVLVAVSKWVLA